MRDRQKSAQQSTAPKSNAPSHLLASRPFAPQPKPEAIGQSPSSAGSESRLLEFAILNPEPGLAQPLQPKLALGGSGTAGANPVDRDWLNPMDGVGRLPLQPKLMIGAPGDKYEQEADRVAAQVVQRLSVVNLGRSASDPTLQRETLPDEDDELQMKPVLQRETLPDEDDELQRKPLTPCQTNESASAATTQLEQTIHTLRGHGQPLADSIRQPMEQAFGGTDFSQVIIHTDARSDQLNRSIHARAFTTQQDIFFRQGEYHPDNQEGKQLLAHELTHVVQQTGSGIRLPISQQAVQAQLTDLPKSIPCDGYDEVNEAPKLALLQNPLDTTGKKISEEDFRDRKKIKPEEGNDYFNDSNLDPAQEQDSPLLGGNLNTPLAVFYKFQLGKNDQLEQGSSQWVFKEDKKIDSTHTKADPAKTRPQDKDPNAVGYGIEKDDAGQSVRSIATYKLDQLFGANISGKTFFAKHRQKLGFVMRFSQGKTGKNALISSACPFKSRIDKLNSFKVISPPQSNTPALTKTLREGLSTMALMDIISGQVDRHGGNYIVEAYTNNVRAIDNDLSFVKDYQNINRGRSNPGKDQNKPFGDQVEQGDTVKDTIAREDLLFGSAIQNTPLNSINPSLIKKILELAENPEEVRKALKFQLPNKEHLSRQEINATISRLRSLAKHLKWRIQRWEIINKKKWGV